MKNNVGQSLARAVVILAVCGLALGACSKSNKGAGNGSGSGATGTVSGLALPSNMSVVTAQDSGSAGAQSAQAVGGKYRSLGIVSSVPANSDYTNDASRFYVYDPSIDPLQTVNMILCLMDQTRATDMVNKGAYIALIDEEKCDSGASAASSESSQSSGTKRYVPWTIVSTRASNSADQLVKIWFPPRDPNAAETEDRAMILVEVTAREGVSNSKPFGDFTLNFRGIADGSTEVFAGSLRTTGNTQFEFYNGGGSGDRLEKAVVNLDNANGTSGTAKTYRYETYNNTTDESTFAVAFNSQHFLRGVQNNGGSIDQSCLSRTQFNTQVWRYNLYNASSGARIARNSGFPFKYTVGSDTVNGYVGYHGVWIENNLSLVDGATIQRVDYSNDTTTPYTVQLADGKLIRRTARSLALANLNNQTLNFWGEHPSLNEWDQWQVVVQNSSNFVITHRVAHNPGQPPTLTPVSNADITPSNGQSLYLWSSSLGGNVVYVGGASNVTFYDEELVYPNDSLVSGGSVTLNCYDRCLKGGLTNGTVNNSGDLYYPNDGTNRTYSLSLSNGKLVLTDLSNNMTVNAEGLSGSTLSNIGHSWGIQSGEMATSVPNNPWEIYSMPVSYRWETGTNSWNKLVTVMNGSSYAVFDKPLQFAYSLEAGDEANGDPNTQAGKTFRLEYGGLGQLHGFPWTFNQDINRWSSLVTLKNGVLLGDNNEYIVKAIEGEQSMKDTGSLTACSAASLDVSGLFSGLNLPNAAAGTVSILPQDKPVVTDAPAVIEGELQ